MPARFGIICAGARCGDGPGRKSMAKNKGIGIWGLGVAVAALIGITALQAGFGSDLRRNPDLMREVRIQLVGDHIPARGAHLLSLLKSGAGERMFDMEAAKSGISLKISDLKASRPLLDNSSRYRKSGVIKVSFTLKDGTGKAEEGTRYYGYYSVPSRGEWTIRNRSSKFQYYLSFII